MIPYRPEEYEFVAYTMPTSSKTKLEAVNLVFIFVFTFSNTMLGEILFTYLIKPPLLLSGGQQWYVFSLVQWRACFITNHFSRGTYATKRTTTLRLFLI
jgi:hypothetical protein